MPDYLNGKLYTIRSHQTDKVYVGSTTQTLSVRMAGHRKDFKRYNKGLYSYVSSFELLKYDDAYIELIELYPCNSKVELDRGEGVYIRQMDCVNKNIAGRTRTEWIEENKEGIKEYQKEYRQNNKEKIAELNKQHYQDNKEYYNEYNKKYKQDNRERIKEQANKKFDCECGGKYTNGNKSTHLGSKKHQKYLNK
jgi:hypothetical protein